MRGAKFLLPAIAWLYAFSAAAQGWVHFSDRGEFFSVNLPHEPTVQETIYHSEFHAELPAKIYTASDGQVDYAITVVDYAPSNVPSPRNVYDLRGSIAYAAWNVRRRGGDITYDAYAQIDRIDGHHLQITNPDQSRTFAAIHLHDSRLYILEAIAAPGTPPPAQFQQSLSILDANGEPIRCELDFRTRVEQPG
jgi:hypothetical protein